jgi:hypothetical protein
MKRFLALLALILLALLATPAPPVVHARQSTWVPPIGIPQPPSGLEPDRDIPTAESQCAAWPEAEATNCWYVDNNTGANCTDTVQAGDSTPRRGYPDRPRCTLPANASVFTRIEIVGGGNAYAFSNRNWDSTGGTEASPAVITGIRDACLNPVLAETWPTSAEASWTDCPIIGGVTDTELQIEGTWLVMQGLNLNRTSLRAAGPYFLNNSIVRWSHAYGSRNGNSVAFSTAFGTSGSTYNNNVVVYQTEVSDWCDMESLGEEDCGGTIVGRGSSNQWIVDNLHWDINGDSIRTGTNPGPGTHTYGLADPFGCPLHDANRAFNIYVGRNTYKLNGENAIDVKDSVRAVFSQNTITGPFNLGGSGTGGGGAISSHNHARDTWIIFNYIETTPIGLAISTDIAGTENGYYLGNIIVDTVASGTFNENASGQNDGAGAHIRSANGDCVFQHNTFYSVQRGLNIETAQTGCRVLDNIVSALTTNHSAFGWEDSAAINGTSAISHNLVHFNGTGRFGNIANTFYANLSAFNLASSVDCASCLEADPLFDNPVSDVFTIDTTSPARDVASGIETYYDLYFTTFGESIKFDRSGTSRPQGESWDIGAMEFDENDPPPDPDPGDPPATGSRLRLRLRAQLNLFNPLSVALFE